MRDLRQNLCVSIFVILYATSLQATGKPYSLPEQTDSKGYSATVNAIFDDIYRILTDINNQVKSLKDSTTSYKTVDEDDTSGLYAKDISTEQSGDLGDDDVQGQLNELDDEKLSKIKDDSTAYTITMKTINTGIGETEVYLMNQNVRTTDNVTFSTVAVTWTVDTRDVSVDGAKLDTIDTYARSTATIITELDPRWFNVNGDTVTGVAYFSTVPYLSDNRTIDNNHHMVDKYYVDEAVTSLGARYYALWKGSGIEDYLLTSLEVPTTTEGYTSKSGLATGDYIAGWISAPGETPPELLSGQYDFKMDMEKTSGNKTLQIYWELVERTASGVEIVLATSTYSDALENGVRSIVNIFLTLQISTRPATTSRIIGKLYAYVTGNGSNPDLTLYYDGDTGSSWLIPTNLNILNDMYVNKNGDTMTGELNTQGINNTGTISSTGTLCLNGNIVFPEPNSYTIGEYQNNRPYKIYVASEVVIGNSIIIDHDNIYSTKLNDYLIKSTTYMITMPALKINKLEILNAGLNSHGRGKFENDIEVKHKNRGVILTSENYKWLIWVDDNGNIFTTKIAESPEISFEERVKLIDEQKTKINNLIKQRNKVSLEDYSARLLLIEKFIGLIKE